MYGSTLLQKFFVTPPIFASEEQKRKKKKKKCPNLLDRGAINLEGGVLQHP